MEYPRPVMSITELHKEMGFSLTELNQMVHIPEASRFARKTIGGGKWLIDTREFEKVRLQRR